MPRRWVVGLLFALVSVTALIGCADDESGPPAEPAPKPTEQPGADVKTEPMSSK